MEFSEVIKSRKSVRSYKTTDVSHALIDKMLMDGHMAPSAGNVRPWEFIVIRDEENRKKIVNTTYPGNDESSDKTQAWIIDAPVIIAVICSKQRMYDKYGQKGVTKYIYLDCSACIENMLLSAVDSGLSSCYISGFRESELNCLLNIPLNYEVMGIMPVGYREGEAAGRNRVPLQNIVHYETYTNNDEVKSN